MSRIPVDPAFTRREQKLGAYAAGVIWVVNTVLLVGLLLWAGEWLPIA